VPFPGRMAELVDTVTRLSPEAAEWLRRRAEHGISAELRQIVRAAREREAELEPEARA